MVIRLVRDTLLRFVADKPQQCERVLHLISSEDLVAFLPLILIVYFKIDDCGSEMNEEV